MPICGCGIYEQISRDSRECIENKNENDQRTI